MRCIAYLSSLLFASSAIAADGVDIKLKAAVDGDARTVEERARDPFRNPYETLTFFGIAPDQTVVELLPGGGWYTAILAPYLKDEGQLIAAHFNLEREDPPSYYEQLYAGFNERFADADRFGSIEVIPFDPPAFSSLGEPGSADLVVTFRNVHSWTGGGVLEEVFASAFEVLRPGGVFGVVGHRMPEDREYDPEERTGYIKESQVIETAERAGFELAGKSEANANPDDSADHANGVWTLPPSLRVPEGEDPGEYRAIGESDRFTLKFVKP